MFRFITVLAIGAVSLSACGPQMMTMSQAMDYCQDKADAAAGPQGNVTVGVGTGGPFFSGGISISDSYLRGDDPVVVYNNCMSELSANGQIIGGTS